MTRRLLLTGAVALALLGGGAGWALRGGGNASAASTAHGTISMATARVARRDLITTDRVDGTLGYTPSPPVVNRLAGTYTQVPEEGVVVQPGAQLYAVDGQPVVLLRGPTPAWRPFNANMADGPDVLELESNLVALGMAHGLFATANAHFDAATANAISRWEHSVGLAETGALELGRVVFLPGAVRVGHHDAQPGAPAAPGQLPFAAAGTGRVVTVALDAAKQAEAVVGAVASIDLGTKTVPGRVTSVGTVASVAGPSQDGGGPGRPKVTVLVTPDDPASTGAVDEAPVQVELTVAARRGVLSVPVTALLAVGGDGEAVEVIGAGGRHTVVRVQTGVASGGYVEVSGAGITEGTTVGVAM